MQGSEVVVHCCGDRIASPEGCEALGDVEGPVAWWLIRGAVVGSGVGRQCYGGMVRWCDGDVQVDTHYRAALRRLASARGGAV